LNKNLLFFLVSDSEIDIISFKFFGKGVKSPIKFILIGGVSAACAFKRYCDQKNEVKSKKDKKTLLLTR